jgi:hypothetical protein
MAQQSFAGLAVLVALAFAIMALHGCANSGQAVSPSATVAIPAEKATPEFHGASLGRDALRSRLPSDD